MKPGTKIVIEGSREGVVREVFKDGGVVVDLENGGTWWRPAHAKEKLDK